MPPPSSPTSTVNTFVKTSFASILRPLAFMRRFGVLHFVYMHCFLVYRRYIVSFCTASAEFIYNTISILNSVCVCVEGERPQLQSKLTKLCIVGKVYGCRLASDITYSRIQPVVNPFPTWIYCTPERRTVSKFAAKPRAAHS